MVDFPTDFNPWMKWDEDLDFEEDKQDRALDQDFGNCKATRLGLNSRIED